MEILGLYSGKGDGTANQDVIGYKDDTFWVVDGATDLFHLQLYHGNDDVALYVNQLSDSIKCELDNVRHDFKGNPKANNGLSEILYNAIKRTNDSLHLDIEEYDVYKMPSFSILMARFHTETPKSKICEYLVLGDCSLQIKDGGNIIEITDTRIAKFSNKNRSELKRLIDSGNYNENQENEIYIRTRSFMNSEHGYWIGSVDGAGIKHAILGEKTLDKDAICLGYSDGLKEAFELFNIAEMDSSVFEFPKLKNVVHRLRDLQEADSDRKLVRVRKRDDLSFILAR